MTAEECTNIGKKYLINNDIEVGTVYRIGDTIAIRDVLSPHSEWVMELKDIFVYGPVRNSYFTFVDGEFYAIRGRIALEHHTKHCCGRPHHVTVTKIARKIISVST